MLEILNIGAGLIIVCFACIKGRKLKWYEMILLMIVLFIFTSTVEKYYI